MNRWIAVVIITAAVVLAGIGLLFGVGIVVQRAIAPVGGSLKEIASDQKEIKQKLDNAAAADLKGVLQRVAALEAKVKIFEEMLGKAGSDTAKQPSQRPQRDVTTAYDVPVGSSAVFGKPDAPVTIVVFNDFQCPFCSRFYPAALEAAKAYPNQVKLVLKHFPLSFHPGARPAAKAALAAGVQGKFYEMTDLLFQNNRSLSDDKFKELAGQLKLNVAQFMKDYKGRDAEWEKKIEEDMELGGKVGVQGTPSYYLNGKAVPPGSPDQWKGMIANILDAKPANPVKK